MDTAIRGKDSVRLKLSSRSCRVYGRVVCVYECMECIQMTSSDIDCPWDSYMNEEDAKTGTDSMVSVVGCLSITHQISRGLEDRRGSTKIAHVQVNGGFWNIDSSP